MMREDGKIINNEQAIVLTGNYIKKELGIPLSKEELKKEVMLEKDYE